MEDEKYQKELFEFDKPKRFLPKLSDFFPKADFERNVLLTLTLDKIVFIAIGIIMIMVVVYALGVEAGKSRDVRATQEPAVPVVQAQAPVVVPMTQPVAVTAARGVVQTQPVPAVRAQSVVLNTAATYSIKKNPVLAGAKKPYTIIAVTLSNKDSAIREMYKLRQLGFSPVLIQNGRYFTICVGAYADKAGAAGQNDLKKVQRLYKDAYLKLR